MQEDGQEYLTAKQVAERLSVKPETVRRWGRTGIIPRHKFGWNVVRYLWSEVQEWLAYRQREFQASGLTRYPGMNCCLATAPSAGAGDTKCDAQNERKETFNE